MTQIQNNTGHPQHKRLAGLGMGGLGLCGLACTAPLLLAGIGASAALLRLLRVVETGGLLIAAVAFTALAAAMLIRWRSERSEPKCGCGTACAAPPDEPPVACDLGVFTPDERATHADRSRHVLSSIRTLRDEEEGFTLFFERSPEIEKEVSSWIDNERRCCPFFRFALERPAGDTLSLRITGPTGAKEILAAGLQEYAPVSYEARRR